MLTSLFKRAKAPAAWPDTQKRIERVSAQLFARIGTPCTARAFRVPNDGGTLLLVELRSDVPWTSESLHAARAILMQGLNHELGFKLKDEDLIVAFARTRAELHRAPVRPRAAAAPRPAEPTIVVTEFGESGWSAFGPTETPPADTDSPQAVRVAQKRDAVRKP